MPFLGICRSMNNVSGKLGALPVIPLVLMLKLTFGSSDL